MVYSELLLMAGSLELSEAPVEALKEHLFGATELVDGLLCQKYCLCCFVLTRRRIGVSVRSEVHQQYARS